MLTLFPLCVPILYGIATAYCQTKVDNEGFRYCVEKYSLIIFSNPEEIPDYGFEPSLVPLSPSMLALVLSDPSPVVSPSSTPCSFCDGAIRGWSTIATFNYHRSSTGVAISCCQSQVATNTGGWRSGNDWGTPTTCSWRIPCCHAECTSNTICSQAHWNWNTAPWARCRHTASNVNSATVTHGCTSHTQGQINQHTQYSCITHRYHSTARACRLCPHTMRLWHALSLLARVAAMWWGRMCNFKYLLLLLRKMSRCSARFQTKESWEPKIYLANCMPSRLCWCTWIGRGEG